jgi:N-ethylmaleimide reductase
LDEEGKISSWSFYFDPNPEVAAFTANLDTELIQAVQNNQLSVVQSLLAIGANVNIRDRNAKGHLTPLMIAAQQGNTEMVKLLLDSGADPYMLDSDSGDSVLHQACTSGSTEVIQLLIEAGAFVNVLSATGNPATPLHNALRHGHLACAEVLVHAGAELNLTEGIGQMDSLKLLQPFKRGNLELPNRMVMAPLTRRRADYHLASTPLNALYYAQRASAGLIISEATQISPQGTSLPRTPGIYSPEQIAGWQLVTQAVHERGGRIFLQLWHGGRCSHPSLQPQGALPVAPSAIAPNEEKALTATEEEVNFVVPRALLTSEIPGIINQYRQAAKNAMLSEADGVEIHGASGYLLDQFLQDNSNQRTDAYGGSIENRARLLMEVTAAVIEVWGSDRVGVRLSPSSTFQDMNDSNPEALFNYVVTQLNSLNLAYLHIVEPRIKGSHDDFSVKKIELGVQHFRPLYQGTLITAGGYTRETGEAILAQGDADLVAYGRLFIANPDLPKRFAVNAKLNLYDRSTFTGGNERGYLDYPFLEKSE